MVLTRKTRKFIYGAMILAGIALFVFGQRNGDRFPEELFEIAAYILVMYGIGLFGDLRESDERRRRRRELVARIKGYVPALMLVAFYVGIVFSKNWTAETVDFLYRYMWIVLIPVVIYLLAKWDRTEDRLRKEFGPVPGVLTPEKDEDDW